MIGRFTGLYGRRRLFALGIGLDVAFMSSLVATPVAALTPPGQVWNTVTQTAWIPIACNLNGTLTFGQAHHWALALRATMPGSVSPGQKFALTNVTAYMVQPGVEQFTYNQFNADQMAATVSDFEQRLTNATGGFAAPDNGTLVNQVRALQPPNTDAPSPPDPLVDPQAGNPAPGQWWTDLGVGDTAERHNVFEFGGIPVDTGSGTSAHTAYGPTPGTGGGIDPNLANDGVAHPINAYPFNVTGAVGQAVTLDVGDASRQVVTYDGPGGDLVTMSQVFFRNYTTQKWETSGTSTQHGFPTPCGKDATAYPVAPDSPGYCASPGVPAGCFVHNFQIPIVAAPGLLRVAQTQATTVPTQVLVDSQIADTWGLTWMKETAGAHTVCFSHVEGWTEPLCQTVTVNNGGGTTVVNGTFTQRGFLHVTTSPAVPSQIKLDGNPTDDWGMFTDVPTGTHTVCFGAVPGRTTPPCQNNVTVTAGATTDVTGDFGTLCPSCTGPSGMGLLRVTSMPAVPTQITINPSAGAPYIADSWGLNWLELPPGSYMVSFAHVQGYTEPPPQTVTVTTGSTTLVVANFTQRGLLHASTSPPVAGTIYVDDIPRNDFGMFTDIPTGSHTVCFGPAPTFASAPPCQAVTITAGSTSTIVGTYPY